MRNALFATPDLIREADVAQRLQVSVATLRRWRVIGYGPRFRKLGASVRYVPADVDAFVEAAASISTTRGDREARGA